MGSVLGCCAAEAGCCALSCCTTCVSKAFGGKSRSAKFAYTAGFILSCIVAFILQYLIRIVFTQFYRKYSSAMQNLLPSKWHLIDTNVCDAACIGYFAVERVGLTTVIYHALLVLGLLGVRDPKESSRASFHHSWWIIKLVIWLGIFVGLCAASLAPLAPFGTVALVGSTIFILIQAVLIIDFAYNLAGTLLARVEEDSQSNYRFLVIGIVLFCYIVTFAVTGFLYYAFAPDRPGCSRNAGAISVHLILVVAQSIIACLPRVQECNPRSGIFQAAVLSVYMTYLMTSALATQPVDASFNCSIYDFSGSNSSPFSTASVVVGTAFLFLSMGYTAYSTGTSGDAFTGRDVENNQEAQDDSEGSYNYSFFHLSFLLAGCYMTSVITEWAQASLDPNSGLVSLSQGSVASVWVKLLTAYGTSLLYIWTLVAPVLFPNRDFS